MQGGGADMGTIRLATLADAERIAEIHNQGIEDRLATLETELRSAADRVEWLAARDGRHPVYVLERDGVVMAWASINMFNPREVYRHVADFSIYVHRSARGMGTGSRLLDWVIQEARRLGFHKLVLNAFPTNGAGMALYARHGFTVVGVYREQGLLDGKWVDTIAMERLLTD